MSGVKLDIKEGDIQGGLRGEEGQEKREARQGEGQRDLLYDSYGRHIEYLRISVTDRCDMRCVYCMPERVKFKSREELLSMEELSAIANTFIDLGVKKVRITGGEPLVRKGIMLLFANLGRELQKGRLRELTLTSNGSQLEEYAEDLYSHGVRRVNISLDTIDKEKFKQITRIGNYDKVMRGIESASKLGMRIKINCVVLRGINSGEVSELVAWCGERGYDITFIEVMPMSLEGEREGQYYPLSEVQEELGKKWKLQSLAKNTGGPARYHRSEELGIDIGFIAPLSHNFCSTCNRVRMSCEGKLYLCLGQEENIDLKRVLRSGEGEIGIRKAIEEGMRIKPLGHDFIIEKSCVRGTQRYMSKTGG